MRYGLSLCVTSILLLAACNPSPTQTPAPPTAAPSTPTPEVLEQAQQPTPFAQVTLPPAGEIVAPATEDPEAGLVFDLITFTQTGGPNNTELTIELHSDGTLVRNGETSTVSQEDIAAIDTMLDAVGFFGLEGIFAGPAPNPDVYSYTLTVERGGASRMLTAEDTYTPQELKQLFAAIINLGQP